MFKESLCTNLYSFNDKKSTKVFQTFYGYWNRVIRFPLNVCHSHENLLQQTEAAYCQISKFKNFSSNAFLKDLKTLLSKFDNEKNIPFSSLKETVNRTHEMRANQTPFINKTLSKEIMKRSHLRNTFLNAKNEIDRRAYKISKIMKKNLFQVLLTLHL